MAPSSVSFDDIIQSGRERKQAEKLANDIFSKGRRASTPQLAPAKSGAPSLASRISKASQRSVSSSPALRSKQNATLNGARARPTAINPRVLQHVQTLNHGQGLTIRGLAGPYVVIASNFAPGTTAADIQSAIENVGGPMDSCRVVTSHPTVMAELVFADKSSAETVIANFNNQKADGRLLHVYMKVGGPSPIVPLRSAPPAPERSNPREIIPPHARDLRPRDTNGGRAEPEFQDGSYGFAAARLEETTDMEMEDDGYYEDYQGDKYGGVRRDDRREDRRKDLPDYEPKYRAPARETRVDSRARPGGGMEGRRLYSDDMYASNQRGRGFR